MRAFKETSGDATPSSVAIARYSGMKSFRKNPEDARMVGLMSSVVTLPSAMWNARTFSLKNAPLDSLLSRIGQSSSAAPRHWTSARRNSVNRGGLLSTPVTSGGISPVAASR